MQNGHKKARIYNITHFVTKAHMFVYGTTVIHTISHKMHVQQDAGRYFIIYDRGTHFQFPKYITIGAKERVKWGPFQQFGPNKLQVLNWGLKCWVRIFNFLQSVTWETPSRHTGLALIWRILRPEEWRPANNRSLQGPGSLNRDPLGCSIFCIRNHISSSN